MTVVNHVTGELVETLDDVAARRLTDRIRLLAETVAEQVEKMADLIDQARTGSAWLALGYSSWTAYVAEEFGGVLPRLDREPRQAFVRELADRGMSTRAIAPIVGASHMTVDRDLQVPVTPVTPLAPQGEVPSGPRDGVPTSVGDVALPPRPAVTGLDGKSYSRPKPIDHAALADAAIAEFPDLSYYRDEAPDLEHCWRLAESLRSLAARGELDVRLGYLRKSIEIDRSKRDGTYAPPVSPSKSCPTCGQEVK